MTKIFFFVEKMQKKGRKWGHVFFKWKIRDFKGTYRILVKRREQNRKDDRDSAFIL